MNSRNGMNVSNNKNKIMAYCPDETKTWQAPNLYEMITWAWPWHNCYFPCRSFVMAPARAILMISARDYCNSFFEYLIYLTRAKSGSAFYSS